MLWSLSTHGFPEVIHFQQQFFKQQFPQLLAASIASRYDGLWNNVDSMKEKWSHYGSENMGDIFCNCLTAFFQSSGFILNDYILYNISIIILNRNRWTT